MDITFGKHAGKALELIILKEPDYLTWMLAQTGATGAMKQAQLEAERLISIFDKKPYIKACEGNSCGKPSTRCTVYMHNVLTPYWWCANCDPYQSGANSGKLYPISTYRQALQHVALHCGGKASDCKAIIKEMAIAKGLPSRVGKPQAQKFFTAS
jgi:hypothetical protein